MLCRFRGGDGLLAVHGVRRGDDDGIHVVLPQQVLIIGVNLAEAPSLKKASAFSPVGSATATNFAWGFRSTLWP